jgi:uncharacterized membrane protein
MIQDWLFGLYIGTTVMTVFSLIIILLVVYLHRRLRKMQVY